MKKNILFFVMLILMADLFAEQVIQSYIRNDWADSRYADHGDGTVTDIRTGLMWKKCSEGQTYENKSCTGKATEHDWKTALEKAQKSRFAGYNDWRVPDIKELASLVAYDRNVPAINITIFPNTPSSRFWSSSPGVSGFSFHVNFYGIDIDSEYDDEYDDRYYSEYDKYDDKHDDKYDDEYDYINSRTWSFPSVRLVRFRQ